LPDDSALARAVIGPSASWSVEAHLLALVHDAVAAGNWQRQGKQNASKPPPLPRPGVADKGRKKFGSVSYEPADFAAKLAAARAAAARAEAEEVTDDGR
jgi:hypothetical protein